MDSIVVCIATYKRPELLRLLLQSIEGQRAVPFEVELCVVDNDPAASASMVLNQSTALIHAIHEPQPGIAAARNAALTYARPFARWIVFVDDDEFVSEDWLERLLEAADVFDADLVTGPVLPHVTSATPGWIIKGGFWVRQSRAAGDDPGNIATNNTLVSGELLRRAPDVWFSEAYSLMGGSDTDFFRRLRPFARRFAWAEDAIVFEHILPERANVKWLFRRATRIGNINARYASSNKFVLLGGAIARLFVGSLLALVDLVIHRQAVARSLNMLAHGVGIVGHLRGKDVVEYRRTNGQ